MTDNQAKCDACVDAALVACALVVDHATDKSDLVEGFKHLTSLMAEASAQMWATKCAHASERASKTIRL